MANVRLWLVGFDVSTEHQVRIFAGMEAKRIEADTFS